jgi:hypothetical protein
MGRAAARQGMTGSPPRRFPPPWRVVEVPHGYAVEDATGQRLGTFYGRAGQVAGELTLDEARRMTVNFTRLPELLKRKSDGGGQMS